jgi:hypothetical protein
MKFCMARRRTGSRREVSYFGFSLFFLSILTATASSPTVRHYASSSAASNGPDRTITWRPWHENQGGDFRFRTGDRYLGGQLWEHYLAFEEHRTSNRATKLSMIRLGSEGVPEDVVIQPGLRYAIVKVTNGTMTAHKGVWSWTAKRSTTRQWASSCSETTPLFPKEEGRTLKPFYQLDDS